MDSEFMAIALHSDHARLFEHNRFVYPVLSRRSGGISIGVNLNPDKICNFDCIYCQVDRRSASEVPFVEVDTLLAELRSTLELVTSGALYETEKFRSVPQHLRRLSSLCSCLQQRRQQQQQPRQQASSLSKSRCGRLRLLVRHSHRP